MHLYPLDTGRKLNVYKMFRTSKRLMYVQFVSLVQGVMLAFSTDKLTSIITAALTSEPHL